MDKNTVNQYFSKICIIIGILVLLSLVLFFDMQANEIKSKYGCNPSGAISGDTPVTENCAVYLEIENAVVFSFGLLIFVIIALILYGLLKSNYKQKVRSHVFVPSNKEYPEHTKIIDYSKYEKAISPSRTIFQVNEKIIGFFSFYWLSKNHKTKIQKFLPFAVVLFFSLILWRVPEFFSDSYIMFGDSNLPLSEFAVFNNLTKEINLWNDLGIGYSDAGRGGFHTPYYIFTTFLVLLEIPLWGINRFLFILPSIIAGLSTFYFSRTIIKGSYAWIVCIFSAIFVVLTPAQIFQNPILSLGFAGVPLILTFYIKALQNQKKLIQYSFIISACSVLVALSPFAFVLVIYIIIIIAIGNLIKKFDPYIIKFTALSLFLIILINFYWVLPFLISSGPDPIEIIYTQESQLGGIGLIETYAPQTSFFDVSRLFYNAENGMSDYFRFSPIILFFSIMLPIYAYFSIIGKNYYLKIFAAVSLLLTIFATGLHYDSFGVIYKWFWNNLPLFKVLNNPLYYLSVLTFFYAVMIGFTTQYILKTIKKRSNYLTPKIFVGIFIGLLIIVNGGMAMNLLDSREHTVNFSLTSNPMKIPGSYPQLLEFLESSNDENYRVLVLPYQSYVQYRWHSETPALLGSGMVSEFSPLPIIGVSPEINQNKPVKELIEVLTKGEMSSAVTLMRELDIKYVLISKDILGNGWANAHPEYETDPIHFKRVLGRSMDIFSPVMKTEEFELYQFNPYSPAPKISIIPTDNQVIKQKIKTYDGEECVCFIVDPSKHLLNREGSIFGWINYQPKNLSIKNDPIIFTFSTEKMFSLQIDKTSNRLKIANFEGIEINTEYIIEPNNWYFIGLTFEEDLFTVYAHHHGFPAPPEIVFRKIPQKIINLEKLPFQVGGLDRFSFFDGKISNIQLYNEALSQEQVSSIFLMDIGGSPPTNIDILLSNKLSNIPIVNKDTLIGWWMPESYSRQISDLSGNKNIGNEFLIEKDVLLVDRSPIEFQKISPSKYEVNFVSTFPTSIVLNEKFDHDWKAIDNGNELIDHLEFNGYANSWSINESGSHFIEIKYMPQNDAEIGFVISAVTSIVLFVLIKSKRISHFL